MAVREGKQNLDHAVWKLVKAHHLQEKRFLLAFSGGTDSLALARVFSKILKSHQWALCYFHHGEGSNVEYRDKAAALAEKYALKWGVSVFILKSKRSARSESQYREQRYQALQQLKTDQGFDLICTAHHRDDLLETRLLRLIRGTGGQGFSAMHVFKADLFRPFLEVGKAELKDYLSSEKLKPLEDPTNNELDPLRNWLRSDLLQRLNKKVPGSLQSLSRSLETLAQDLESAREVNGNLLSKNEDFKTQGLSRSYYLTLTPREQKTLLAQYLFALGIRDFSQSHLEEIQKRLDNSQKVITFKVGGCLWQINAQQVKVQS